MRQRLSSTAPTSSAGVAVETIVSHPNVSHETGPADFFSPRGVVAAPAGSVA
ncbi:hypothetical protein ACWEPC_24895 [Nonomuraea sp. NPDC004297]